MTATERIARLRIELDETEPVIWRRVEVPLSMSLKGLHGVIQAVMGRQNCHLFEFDVGGKPYGMPCPERDAMRRVPNAKSEKLASLIERNIETFGYVYDFGDDWRHTITVEAVAAADPRSEYPRLVEGMRRGPPEDVGGIGGYHEFWEAVTKPRHRERKRLLERHGGPYDPDDIGLPVTTSRLDQLARRRMLGRAASEKSRERRH